MIQARACKCHQYALDRLFLCGIVCPFQFKDIVGDPSHTERANTQDVTMSCLLIIEAATRIRDPPLVQRFPLCRGRKVGNFGVVGASKEKPNRSSFHPKCLWCQHLWERNWTSNLLNRYTCSRCPAVSKNCALLSGHRSRKQKVLCHR
jgi:hypothetical protein